MSWLFSQALVAEYSDRISWDCEQSAQLNVMPTQHKFWRNDKMMEFSRLSQFGLTLQLLTEEHGQELLTLYLADFHAKTSVVREKVQGSMESVQVSGQKWHELLVKFDLDSCSWKTHQCLFPEDLQESSVILPKWCMTRTGHVFQHLTLERPISVTGSGLLPTPDASEGNRGPAKQYDSKAKSQSGRTLTTWVASFPTPQASDCRDRGNLGSPVIQRRIQKGKQIGLSMSVSDISGALNPDWVEWLMGWPIGWTDLKPLEMDKFQSWLKAHLNF